MIVVVGGIKGGTGKTTLCINLASMRAKTGKQVCLFDGDEQESTLDYCLLRNSFNRKIDSICYKVDDKNMADKCEEVLENGFDDVFIDVGGRDTKTQRAAMCVSDIFLTPFLPRSLDLWTMDKLEDLIKEVKEVNPNLQCFAVVNRADFTGEDNTEAKKMLNESPHFHVLPFTIGQRKVFANSLSLAKNIFEMPLKEAAKALQEMKMLYKYIFGTKFTQE